MQNYISGLHSLVRHTMGQIILRADIFECLDAAIDMPNFSVSNHVYVNSPADFLEVAVGNNLSEGTI